MFAKEVKKNVYAKAQEVFIVNIIKKNFLLVLSFHYFTRRIIINDYSRLTSG